MTYTRTGYSALTYITEATLTTLNGIVFTVQIGAYYWNDSSDGSDMSDVNSFSPRFRIKMSSYSTSYDYYFRPNSSSWVQIPDDGSWTDWVTYANGGNLAVGSVNFQELSLGRSSSKGAGHVYTSIYSRSLVTTIPSLTVPSSTSIVFNPTLDRRGYITAATLTNTLTAGANITLHINCEGEEKTFTYTSDSNSSETVTIDVSEWGQDWLDGMQYTYWYEMTSFASFNYSFEDSPQTFTFPSVPHGITVTGLSSNFADVGETKSYSVSFSKRSGATGAFYDSSYTIGISDTSIINSESGSLISLAEGSATITIAPADEYATSEATWKKIMYVLGGDIPAIESPIEVVDVPTIETILESESIINTYLTAGITIPDFSDTYAYSVFKIQWLLNKIVTNCATLITTINSQSVYPTISVTSPSALNDTNEDTQWYTQMNLVVTALNAMKESIDSVENA